MITGEKNYDNNEHIYKVCLLIFITLPVGEPFAPEDAMNDSIRCQQHSSEHWIGLYRI